MRVAAFFVFLFVVEWYLYFRSIGHCFQGDTVFLLHHRVTSLGQSSERIRPGESFFIGMTGAHDVVAKIAYIVDNGLTQVFDANLGGQGRARLDVSESTRKGSYRFVAFKIAYENSWIRSDAKITVE
jgi:hypothetical protein